MEFILVDRWGLVDVNGVRSCRPLGVGECQRRILRSCDLRVQ